MSTLQKMLDHRRSQPKVTEEAKKEIYFDGLIQKAIDAEEKPVKTAKKSGK